MNKENKSADLFFPCYPQEKSIILFATFAANYLKEKFQLATLSMAHIRQGIKNANPSFIDRSTPLDDGDTISSISTTQHEADVGLPERHHEPYFCLCVILRDVSRDFSLFSGWIVGCYQRGLIALSSLAIRSHVDIRLRC